DTLAARNGTHAIDGAFHNRPTTEQDIIDPVVYFANRKALPVAVPNVAADDKRQDTPDDFGALTLFITLDARIGFDDALHAAESRAGDRYVSFRRDGHTCVRIGMRGRTAAATRTLGTALQSWAAAGPANAATVDVRPSLATLTACDLGGGTAPSFDTLDQAVTTMATRVEIIGELIRSGGPPAAATCVADHVVTDPTLAPLLQKSDLAQGEEQLLQSSVGKFVSACG